MEEKGLYGASSGVRSFPIGSVNTTGPRASLVSRHSFGFQSDLCRSVDHDLDILLRMDVTVGSMVGGKKGLKRILLVILLCVFLVIVLVLDPFVFFLED